MSIVPIRTLRYKGEDLEYMYIPKHAINLPNNIIRLHYEESTSYNIAVVSSNGLPLTGKNIKSEVIFTLVDIPSFTSIMYAEPGDVISISKSKLDSSTVYMKNNTTITVSDILGNQFSVECLEFYPEESSFNRETVIIDYDLFDNLKLSCKAGIFRTLYAKDKKVLLGIKGDNSMGSLVIDQGVLYKRGV